VTKIHLADVLLAQKHGRIATIPFDWRKFRPTGYLSSGFGG